MAPTPALALLLALLSATPGLGVPGGRCGVPPPACCQSWETALRCGALGHCLRRAWAPPGTDVCADCQQIITLLIHMANESAIKADVEGFLRRECAALPVPTMVSPCQNLVHEYFSLLLTDLQGHLVAAGEALPVPLPLCWLCRTFLTRAEAAVPKEAVAAAAAGLCRALPAVVAGACQCLAQRYAVLALEGVLGRLAPRLLCHLLLACRSEDTHRLLAPPGAPPEDPAAPKAACGGSEDLGPGHSPPMLSPNLGPCALGPSYWCSSPEAARRCQALQHCQEHVWA